MEALLIHVVEHSEDSIHLFHAVVHIFETCNSNDRTPIIANEGNKRKRKSVKIKQIYNTAILVHTK